MSGTGRMRIGCCAGLADAELVRDAGYDYIELPTGTLMSAETEEEYRHVMRQIAAIGLPIDACNVFIPANLKITGPDVEQELLWSYAALALQRMSEIGVRVCVFGSGGARSIPEGFDRATALDQLQVFLEHVQTESVKHNVRVVIEPLNTLESNVFNSVSESDRFNGTRGLTGIGVLADLYHISMEHEGFDGTRDADGRLWHAHVADADRRPPGEGAGADYAAFFRTLKQIGYPGTISVEARWQSSRGDELRGTDDPDRETEHHRALAFVRQQWDAATVGSS
jgi:sugar phosphate isomerase/epimerase